LEQKIKTLIGLRGYILSFRRGGGGDYPKQVLIKFPNINNYKEAARLLGRKVVWRNNKGNEIRGVIRRLHGKKGVVVAYFRKPLPGQALGTEVFIVG